MNAFAYFLLFLTVALPIAWLISEFKCRRLARILFGLSVGILTCFCVSAFVGVTTTFRFNTWYGENTKRLVDETIRQLETGNTTNVLNSFKKLQNSYQPTYENRADYNLLVSNAVDNMSQLANSSHGSK
jgi:hypothetical protein